MKSFLDFVVCCRGTNTNPPVPPAPEEERSIVLATSEPVQSPAMDYKTRSSRPREWRPSLSAILEDGFIPEITRRSSSSSGSERMLIRRKCSSSAATANDAGSRSRTHNGGDYRRYDRPVVVPAFAPTFWF